MDFPTTEPQIMTLVYRMLNGYFWHAADFPSIPSFIRIRLFSTSRTYGLARIDLVEAQANLRVQTKATKKKLLELKQVMKNCLQKSEVDVAANPEKLKQIGWGPRTEPQPAQLPAQPTDLQITAKDNQTVKLKWDRPSGGGIRNYIIERRQENGDGVSNWTIFQIAYDTQATLKSQPTGICLEYRVRAANTAGTGPFSNTVSVIL